MKYRGLNSQNCHGLYLLMSRVISGIVIDVCVVRERCNRMLTSRGNQRQHSMEHNMDGNRKRKYVTKVPVSVCEMFSAVVQHALASLRPLIKIKSNTNSFQNKIYSFYIIEPILSTVPLAQYFQYPTILVAAP